MMILALALCLALFEDPAGEPLHAEPIPLENVIQSLIRDLGAESYDVRERATQSLRRIGYPALAALEKAAESDDPEVRMRARSVLADVRLGISPDWPSDIVLQVRHFEQLDERQRRNAISRVAQALKEKAVPFLLLRMAAGSEQEARYALQYLRNIGSEEVYQKVVQLIKEPKSDHQAEALAWARAQLGQADEALEVLVKVGLDGAIRNEVLEAGVKQLMGLLSSRKHRQVIEAAAKLTKAYPNEARFLYLQAEALTALDKDAEAQRLRNDAVGLNRDKEPPHYTAGELLRKLGRRRLAAREWQSILEIPPADEVYDINAYLRLGAIYSASGLFRQAAESMGKALELFVKARNAGAGMAMTGGTEESLRTQIQRLHQKAEAFPIGQDSEIEDELPPNHLNVRIHITVKDGKHGELYKALDSVAGVLTVNVEPQGLRLLDVAPVSVRYDPDKRHVAMSLRESPCCKPIAIRLEGPKARIAINSLDCCYVFEVDTRSGEAEKIARFEKDYTVTFRPGVKLAAYSGVMVTINDKKYDWQKLLEGVEFDYLPKKLEIVLQGTKPSGKRVTSRFNLGMKEPDIRAIRDRGGTLTTRPATTRRAK